jgi:hypothetical protein
MNTKFTIYKKILIVLIVLASIYAVVSPAKGTAKVTVNGVEKDGGTYDMTGFQYAFIAFLVFLLVLSFIF